MLVDYAAWCGRCSSMHVRIVCILMSDQNNPNISGQSGVRFGCLFPIELPERGTIFLNYSMQSRTLPPLRPSFSGSRECKLGVPSGRGGDHGAVLARPKGVQPCAVHHNCKAGPISGGPFAENVYTA